MKTGKKQRYAGKFHSRNPLDFWRAVIEGIGEEIGTRKTAWFLFASVCSDPVLKPVRWDPALFPGLGPENVQVYRKCFRHLKWFINLSRNLLNEYGEDVARYLTAKVAFATAVPTFSKTFGTKNAFDDLARFRQYMPHYLGLEGEISWRETSPVNNHTVCYRITHCVHVEILKAYVLQATASAFCLSDHVTYNNPQSKLNFIRSSCLSFGDAYCELQFNSRKAFGQAKDKDHCKEIKKADFNAKRMIEAWKKKMYPPVNN